jgi:hypothetical protein
MPLRDASFLISGILFQPYIGGLLEWDMWARIDRSRLARSHKYASIRPQIGLPRFPIGPPPRHQQTTDIANCTDIGLDLAGNRLRYRLPVPELSNLL